MPQRIRILIEKYVSEVQKIYGNHLRQVVLYGSYARGDYTAESDVDIKPIAKSEEHFMKWIENYPFYSSISKERVLLYGRA